MSNYYSGNKRLAKNTMLLYCRMILLLCVSLYTSRVVLSTLGFIDYGIYNVVGGIVVMFGFINMALANSTSRFITYALGKGNLNQTQLVFNSSIIVHVVIAAVIVLLLETIGLWFLNNKIVIPPERLYAAGWVFQFSIIACVISILYVPFNAMIIAHEKMGAFAYISILDAALKLLIVYVISVCSGDRLILYAFLLLCVNILNICVYIVYCKRNFEEVVFKRVLDLVILKQILSFAGWSMIGNIAYVGYTQGLNILLNLFFGPIVNAARGIATQLQNAVLGFVTNFQMAVNPQITKSYAQGDFSRLHTLIFTSSKFSFFLLFCIILPLSIESNFLLRLWLSEAPEYAAQFTILTLFTRLVDTLSNPIDMAINASGKIKYYQIFEGCSLLLIVPIAYVVLKLGGCPVSVFYVQLFIMYAVQILRLFLVCNKIKMRIMDYIKRVLVRILVVALLSPILPLILKNILTENLLSFLIIIPISSISVIVCVYFLGLEENEKHFIKTKLIQVKHKL